MATKSTWIKITQFTSYFSNLLLHDCETNYLDIKLNIETQSHLNYLMWRDKIYIPQLWTYKLYNSYILKCGPKHGARPTLAENLLTKTHKQEKLNLRNAASKDTTLQSTQAFSTLPHTHGENEKLEIWKYFFLEKNGKKLEKMEKFM